MNYYPGLAEAKSAKLAGFLALVILPLCHMVLCCLRKLRLQKLSVQTYRSRDRILRLITSTVMVQKSLWSHLTVTCIGDLIHSLLICFYSKTLWPLKAFIPCSFLLSTAAWLGLGCKSSQFRLEKQQCLH